MPVNIIPVKAKTRLCTGRMAQRKRTPEECSWDQADSRPGLLVLFPISNMEGKGWHTQVFRATRPEFYTGQMDSDKS